MTTRLSHRRQIEMFLVCINNNKNRIARYIIGKNHCLFSYIWVKQKCYDIYWSGLERVSCIKWIYILKEFSILKKTSSFYSNCLPQITFDRLHTLRAQIGSCFLFFSFRLNYLKLKIKIKCIDTYFWLINHLRF